MILHVRPFTQSDAIAWDEFCGKSLQATLLHTRRFLSYHGDRFVDRSLVIEQGGKWLGVFPAALSRVDLHTVVSHPGITYGGIVHQGNLRGDLMINALKAIISHYGSLQLTKLVYKVVPFCYHQAPVQDDLYALFRLGAFRSRCDISSTIDLQHQLPISDRRRRSQKKSVKAGIDVIVGSQNLIALWDVLTENLASKHGAHPVHSSEEITQLAERFPDHIRCVCARLGERVLAGVVLFITTTAHHAQYIASNLIGYEVSALDAVFEHCILTAKREGKRWFDFGINNEKQGVILNNGLYKFKNEFGAGGVVHEFYEINLNAKGDCGAR